MRVFLIVSALLAHAPASAAPVRLTGEAPVSIRTVEPGVVLLDFGNVAFGNLLLNPPSKNPTTITVHFGEALSNGRINRNPPGSVRYATTKITLSGSEAALAAPTPDKRNTLQPAAVLTPREWGTLIPFRWIEIQGWPGEIQVNQIIRRAAYAESWNDHASGFHCSDESLNQIHKLCRHSIKATTFAGVFVDGDRERICYEADAYLNQISRHAIDGDTAMARDTFDRLAKLPTWPSEWATHMIFMAYADWMQTGDIDWLKPRYDLLRSKMLSKRAREDGLITSSARQQNHDDLVDWPPLERDGFVFTRVNTVINSFHLRSLGIMAELARALGNQPDADTYDTMARTAQHAFQQKLFDAKLGLYRDGEDTDHTSLHANLFPLAFGIVPAEHRPHISKWLQERGMKCSVYAAQYLLQGLFENNGASGALDLITAPGDRSWKHMVDSGATITWEAWDHRYKPNQDWNHAWGAAPANLLPRYVLGVKPLAPGWKQIQILPNPGKLQHASGKVPTPLGPVEIQWENNEHFKMTVSIPDETSARVFIPASTRSSRVLINGKPADAHREAGLWRIHGDLRGKAIIETR